MDLLQSLSVDEAERIREGCPDDWMTEAWRSLARFLMLGSYLQGAAAKFLPQEKALLPDPGPNSYKLSQGRAGMMGECGQYAWRSLAKFIRRGSRLQSTAAGLLLQKST